MDDPAPLQSPTMEPSPTDPEAQCQLALTYLEAPTKGAHISYPLAFQWMQKAAKQGLPRAQGHLAIMYDNADGVSRSIAKAIKWAGRASAQGELLGRTLLAGFTYLGWGGLIKLPPAEGIPLLKEALEALRKEARGGCHVAQVESAMVDLLWSEMPPELRDPQCGPAHVATLAGSESATALAVLGAVYTRGLYGVEKDMEKGVGYFERATEKGSKLAYFLWADYLLSMAAPGDTEAETAAVAKMEKAAALGQYEAHAVLGQCFLEGRPGPKDAGKAVAAFRAGAAAEDREALYMLGRCYWEATGIPQDNAKAAECFRDAAEMGHVEAQTMYGFCLLTGRGVPQDGARAVLWLRKAADGGSPLGEHWLGKLYMDGAGVPADGARALALFRRAAEKGCHNAQDQLGDLYFLGEGGLVSKDEAEGMKWYRKGAAGGNPYSQYMFGIGCWTGRGTDEDEATAIEMWKKAVVHGHIGASERLGICYLEGRGVPKDAAKGVALLEAAAEGGAAAAMMALAGVYFVGEKDVEKDVLLAVTLLRKAAEKGHGPAALILEELQGESLAWEPLESFKPPEPLDRAAAPLEVAGLDKESGIFAFTLRDQSPGRTLFGGLAKRFKASKVAVRRTYWVVLDGRLDVALVRARLAADAAAGEALLASQLPRVLWEALDRPLPAGESVMVARFRVECDGWVHTVLALRHSGYPFGRRAEALKIVQALGNRQPDAGGDVVVELLESFPG